MEQKTPSQNSQRNFTNDSVSVSHPTSLLTLFLQVLTLTNMSLVYKQHVCIKILGTNLKDSDSDLQAFQLQEIC